MKNVEKVQYRSLRISIGSATLEGVTVAGIIASLEAATDAR